MKRTWALGLMVAGIVGWANLTRGETTQLAGGGKALMPIVVSAKASEGVKASAQALATQLGRISGATFTLNQGDGQKGIAVGLVGDFPQLALARNWPDAGVSGREQYQLKTHDGGLYVVGRTDLAVQDGVWDLLYRLGYRQFFPGAAWEVVPHSPDLTIDVDVVEAPAYASRRIWPGYNTWKENGEEWATYRVRNRMGGAFGLSTGHAYARIIKHFKKEFDAHPEYYALVKGKRTGSKMCQSNPAVRKMMVQYALDYFKENPDADCVSLEPSDGGGWCECDQCAKLGTPSNRVLSIANEAADAVQKAYPNKYVAFYGYSSHSNPPTGDIKANPIVIVNVATAFITQTPQTLIRGWLDHGVKQFGIREYYGVNVWDRDMPGKGRGAQIAYLQKTIPEFHALGARFMTAEASDNWGPNGLGYYLAGRMMWDVKAADHLDALEQDFYDKAFGPAAKPMADFYQRINITPPLLSSDLLGRMYRDLAEATKLAGGNTAIQTRINDLVLYTHYIELFRNYASASGAARQKAFEDVISFAYRIRRTHMVHALALYRDLPNRDHSVKVPADATWRVAEGKNPWKSSKAFTQQEVNAFVSTGIRSNALMDFQAKAFSDELVSAAPLHLKAPVKAKTQDLSSRGTVRYYTWIDKAPATVRLKVTAGLIVGYRSRGPAELKLFSAGATDGEAVDHAAVPADGNAHEVTLKTEHTGLHWVELSDKNNMTKVEWAAGTPWTIPLAQSRVQGRPTLYFYVPRGTRTVGGYAHASGPIFAPDGKKVFDLPAKAGFFAIPVKAGQDGKLWAAQVGVSGGGFKLMTVPPYMAARAEELMLPREVVEGK
jgi:hypothetical protein